MIDYFILFQEMVDVILCWKSFIFFNAIWLNGRIDAISRRFELRQPNFYSQILLLRLHEPWVVTITRLLMLGHLISTYDNITFVRICCSGTTIKLCKFEDQPSFVILAIVNWREISSGKISSSHLHGMRKK